MKRTVAFLASGFFLLFSITVLFFEPKVIASALLGYFTSTFILLASMRSYRRVVEKGVMNQMVMDERDAIDKVEDPYGLFGEEESPKESPPKDLVEVVKEERSRLKGRSFVETLKDSRASLAPYRILSYAVMVVGFVFLQRNHLLSIFPYLIALTLPIVVVVVTLSLFEKYID